ncbi:MAG: hypothetical protein JWN04_3276 [Myxococcaceae bacterium]|nr:hypothetical protein [Myxococcaceae bacterium]
MPGDFDAQPHVGAGFVVSPRAGHGGTIVSKGDDAFGAFTILLYVDNDAEPTSERPGADDPPARWHVPHAANAVLQLAVTRCAAGGLRTYIDGVLMSTDAAIH